MRMTPLPAQTLLMESLEDRDRGDVTAAWMVVVVLPMNAEALHDEVCVFSKSGATYV